MRRTPGVTRWQKWSWRACGVLVGAEPADWHELRSESDIVDFHAGTVQLELHGADAEAYLHGLTSQVPSIYIILRPTDGDPPLEIVLATASPYEAQDYCDSGEDIVEKVPMPPIFEALVRDFVDEFYQEEEFIKRKRDKKRVDLVQDGIGDPRIGKAADIYSSPAQLRRRLI